MKSFLPFFFSFFPVDDFSLVLLNPLFPGAYPPPYAKNIRVLQSFPSIPPSSLLAPDLPEVPDR